MSEPKKFKVGDIVKFFPDMYQRRWKDKFGYTLEDKYVVTAVFEGDVHIESLNKERPVLVPDQEIGVTRLIHDEEYMEEQLKRLFG